jgi:hypothetical protein
MDLGAALRIAVYVALLGASAVVIWGVFQVVAAARSVQRLADDADALLPPLADKANVTLDNFNDELVRMDGVVAQLEEVSDRVNSTTRAAQGIVEAPAAAVSGLAEGVRTFLGVLTGRRL